MELSVRRGAVTVKNVVSDACVDRGWRLAYLKIDSFLRPDAEMSRAMNYPLAVAQDALVCSLPRPR